MVKIIADSTCDLPLDLAKKWNIDLIPANIVFDDEVISHFSITNDAFYQRLINGEMSTTAVPAPKAFKTSFDNALKESNDVVMITLSKKLSAMFSTASMVSEKFFDNKITIFDSESCTLEMGLLVYLAGKKASEGGSKQAMLDFLNSIKPPKSNLIGVVDSLKYLKKGGRISTISWLVGSLLSVKPIIHIENGVLDSPGKVVGKTHAVELLKKLVKKALEKLMINTIIVGHSDDLAKAKSLVDYIHDLPNPPEEIITCEIGPVVGSHVGPGAIGISWIGEYNAKWLK